MDILQEGMMQGCKDERMMQEGGITPIYTVWYALKGRNTHFIKYKVKKPFEKKWATDVRLGSSHQQLSEVGGKTNFIREVRRFNSCAPT